MILTCRTPDGRGSGWAGITGVKDLSLIDPVQHQRDRRRQGGQEPEAARAGARALHRHPRVAARGAVPLADDRHLQRARRRDRSALLPDRQRSTAPRSSARRCSAISSRIKSDIGNPILRQTPILPDGTAARPVTWVEKGVLKNLYYDQQYAARAKKDPTPRDGEHEPGAGRARTQSVEQMIKSTRRGLLVSFFWYIRAVDQPTLLNTGMTRDGLFLIENGEIAGPVQNFRWNMSPLVGFNNVTAIGQSVPMHTGESYDGGGTALVPAVRIEDFYMTSVSPAV